MKNARRLGQPEVVNRGVGAGTQPGEVAAQLRELLGEEYLKINIQENKSETSENKSENKLEPSRRIKNKRL